MSPTVPHGPHEGVEAHHVHVSREPDDLIDVPGLGPTNVLRISIGGTDDVGYYLKFRGEPEHVIKTLEMMTEVARQQLPHGRYEDLRHG